VPAEPGPPGAGRLSPAAARGFIDRFAAAGYRVEVQFVAGPRALSGLGVLDRLQHQVDTLGRGANGREEVEALESGVSLTIPLGTTLQFRAGAQGLRAVAVTVPPWQVDSPDEARFETGRW
jgi:hypothetical protein